MKCFRLFFSFTQSIHFLGRHISLFLLRLFYFGRRCRRYFNALLFSHKLYSVYIWHIQCILFDYFSNSNKSHAIKHKHTCMRNTVYFSLTSFFMNSFCSLFGLPFFPSFFHSLGWITMNYTNNSFVVRLECNWSAPNACPCAHVSSHFSVRNEVKCLCVCHVLFERVYV